MVESTGVVVSPYMEHPQLLSLLLRILTDGTPHARMEVVKVAAPMCLPACLVHARLDVYFVLFNALLLTVHPMRMYVCMYTCG